ncbi:MAG: hypothetical protein H0X66_01770 [Verrucomicrobia bacterium]|nr:hypothetical protein [Verrucomicrobiota bacterium]
MDTVTPTIKKELQGGFRWAVSIEGSCIPHLNIDEYQWTQHDQYWREDFQLHHVGKIHRVGIYELQRESNGDLKRSATPLADDYRNFDPKGGRSGRELHAGTPTENQKQNTNLCHLRN